MGGVIQSGLGEWNDTGSGQNAPAEEVNRKAQVTAHFLKGVSTVKKLGAIDLKCDKIFLSLFMGASITSCFVCWLLWKCFICKTKKTQHHEPKYSIPLTALSSRHWEHLQGGVLSFLVSVKQVVCDRYGPKNCKESILFELWPLLVYIGFCSFLRCLWDWVSCRVRMELISSSWLVL